MSNKGGNQLPDAGAVTLKTRFLAAVAAGELGRLDDQGAIVTLQQFKAYFKVIKTQYITSFLPAATIDVGQYTATHTKYVFRLRKGVYRVHPDALEAHIQRYGIQINREAKPADDSQVKEPGLLYDS